MAGRPDNNGERRYIGVRNRGPGRYGAEVYDRVSKRRLWLGTFDTALEAALAYDKATRRFNGRRANTNFPLAFEVPDDEITLEEAILMLVRGPEEPTPVDLEVRLGQPGSFSSHRSQTSNGLIDGRSPI